MGFFSDLFATEDDLRRERLYVLEEKNRIQGRINKSNIIKWNTQKAELIAYKASLHKQELQRIQLENNKLRKENDELRKENERLRVKAGELSRNFNRLKL